MTSTAVETTDPVARLKERPDRIDEKITGDPASQALALRDEVDYARTLATADILPKSFAGKSGNVLWALAYARALGLDAPIIMQNLHVIDGKAGMSADLVASLVRRAGHRLRVTADVDEAGLPTARAEIVRKDDPDFTYVAEWDIPKAVTAGLCSLKDGKPYARSSGGNPLNWEKYPGTLCKRRATTEVARDACPEVLLGIGYDPDELEHQAPAEPVQVKQGEAPSSIIAAAEAVRTPAPAEPQDELGADGHPIEDAEVVEDLPASPPEDMITKAQIVDMAKLMKQAEITGRADALDYCQTILGRPITSRNELTRVEADEVNTELRKFVALNAGPDEAEQQAILAAEKAEAGS
jgi:hypothetical protein